MTSNFGLNPFKKGKKSKTERIKKVEVDDNPQLEKVLQTYNLLHSNEKPDFYKGVYSVVDVPSVSPPTINSFLTYVIQNNLFKHVAAERPQDNTQYKQVTITYLNHLIQKSYNKGNNKFYLNTLDVDMPYLCSNLKGKKNNLLSILINGNVFNKCCSFSEYLDITLQGNSRFKFAEHIKGCKFNIQGDTDFCGFTSEDSYFEIQGNAETAGHLAKRSKFYIAGNVDMHLGLNSSYSTFIVKGNIGDHCGVNSIKSKFITEKSIGIIFGDESKSSEFMFNDFDEAHFSLAKNILYKTQNQNTYEKLLNIIKNRSCTAQLLDKEGKVLKEYKK